MVCPRCISAVKNIFDELEIQYSNITLGEVDTLYNIPNDLLLELKKRLSLIGFEVIDNKKSRIIEKIKTLIIELVHHSENNLKTNLSDYLSKKLNYDYNYLSNIFSETEGKSVESFYILQKIEKVKELLVYDELSLSEISYKLGYSSVAHLSNQFKKITGLSPSHFKKIGNDRRNSLDKL